MTDDERWKAFIALARAYLQLKMDWGILTGIIVQAQSKQVAPQDWQGELEEIRNRPVMRLVHQENESLLDELERNRREYDLQRLLDNLPTTGSVN